MAEKSYASWERLNSVVMHAVGIYLANYMYLHMVNINTMLLNHDDGII